MTKQDIIEQIDKRGEFGALEDGFTYYFPIGRGAISSAVLRIIADELDERNCGVQKDIDEYFASHPIET